MKARVSVVAILLFLPIILAAQGLDTAKIDDAWVAPVKKPAMSIDWVFRAPISTSPRWRRD